MNIVELDKFTKEIDDIFIDFHKNQNTGFCVFDPYERDFKKALENIHEDVCEEELATHPIFEVDMYSNFDVCYSDSVMCDHIFQCVFYIYEKGLSVEGDILDGRYLKYSIYPECITSFYYSCSFKQFTIKSATLSDGSPLNYKVPSAALRESDIDTRIVCHKYPQHIGIALDNICVQEIHIK